MKYDAQAIVAEIEEKAKQANMSISELCRRSNIDRSTFQRWKDRTCEPSLGTLKNIFIVLDEEEAKRNDPA